MHPINPNFILVGDTGLEPVTSPMSTTLSNQSMPKRFFVREFQSKKIREVGEISAPPSLIYIQPIRSSSPPEEVAPGSLPLRRGPQMQAWSSSPLR